jgi:hypothetical protein
MEIGINGIQLREEARWVICVVGYHIELFVESFSDVVDICVL